jgi:flagellar hook-basal body complex protein FliE
MDAISVMRMMRADPAGMQGGADVFRGPKLIPQQELQSLHSAESTSSTQSTDGSFSNTLGKLVDEVNLKQIEARESVNALLSGQNVPLHQTMIAMEEASVSFQLMVEVRNKLLESYQELMRMQI